MDPAQRKLEQLRTWASGQRWVCSSLFPPVFVEEVKMSFRSLALGCAPALPRQCVLTNRAGEGTAASLQVPR